MPTTYSRKTSLFIISLLGFLERFGYYGLHAHLFLYLIDTDTFNLTLENVQYYTGFLVAGISISALVIGIFIDLLIKQEKAIFIGGFLIICGYALLLFKEELLVLPSILALIVGINFVKPSLIIMIGKLFKKEDKRRDLGYMLFFLSPNLGAFLSIFLIGRYVVDYGFGINVFVVSLMIITLLYLVIFFFTKHKLNFIEEDLNELKSFFPKDKENTEMDFILDADDSNRLTVVEFSEQEESGQKMKPLMLIFIVISFIALYANLATIGNQSYWGYLLNNAANLSFLGFEMSQVNLTTLQLILELAFTTIFFLIWYFVGIGSTLTKINLSFLFLAIGTLLIYLIMIDDGLSNYWMMPLLFIGLSDVLIAPIALSYITRLSKMNYATTVLGLYTLCTYLGSLLFDSFWGNSIRREWLVFSIITLLVLVFIILAFRKQLLNLSNGLD